MVDTSLLPAMAGAFLAFIVLIIIAVYVYTSLALMTIAKKTKTENAWLAWIPLVNLYLMVQIAKVPTWTILAILLLIIPMIGTILFLAVYIWWWWKIAEARKKPGWISLLLIIPLVNLIVMGVIAWAE